MSFIFFDAGPDVMVLRLLRLMRLVKLFKAIPKMMVRMLISISYDD